MTTFSNFSPITNLDNLLKTLDTYGVAVVPNVFTIEECELVKTSVFNYLARNHEVHKPDDYHKLSPLGGGILHYYGIGLLKEILDMKTDPRVIQIFENLWYGEKVTMSLDGIGIIPPPEQMQMPIRQPTGFHTDQSNAKKEKCCIQGILNLENTNEGDGCLSVLTHSHNHHQEFFEHFKIDTNRRDWYVLNTTSHYNWFLERGCEWKKILAPIGSLILFDSRTIHKATAPMPNRPHPDHWRFVVYVCYTPARFQSKDDVRKKIKAYLENKCTSHWPYNVSIFNKMRDDNKENQIFNLTVQHKKCLGIQ